jgi:hypothetical protein
MTVNEVLNGIQWPAGIRPAPSWEPENRSRLDDEVEMYWLLKGRFEPPWVREYVLPDGHKPFEGPALVGYTIDAGGNQVRAWLVSERSLAAYERLQARGTGTCPIEAVLPWTLHLGLPSLPAHICGGRHADLHAQPLLHLWALLATGIWGECQGLSVGLPELVQSLR